MSDLFSQQYRIFVAIDSQNLYHAAKHEFGQEAKVDYRRLKELLIQQCAKYHRSPDIEAVVYTVARDKFDSNNNFITMLESIGFLTRTQCVPYTPQSAKNSERFEWSTGVTIDTIKRAMVENPIQRFVLVTGSGVFQPLVVELKNAGILTDLYSFRQSLSGSLSQVVENLFILDKQIIWDRAEYYVRKSETCEESQ